VLTHLLFFFYSLVFTQYHPQEWGSITSLLTPTGIQVARGGIIYASTSGGLLKFDPKTERFSSIKMEEGLVYLDLSTIEVDDQGRLWLGGSYPNGYLQVYDPEKGLVRQITHLDISEIKMIRIGVNKAFAVYEGTTSSDLGILEFELDEEGLPEYRDYYTNFTDETIIEIRDLDIFQNSIYITTDQGIFVGNYSDNLKSSSEWDIIYLGSNALQFLPEHTGFIVTDSLIIDYSTGDQYYNYYSDLPHQCEKKYNSEYIECMDDLFCYEYPAPTDEQPNNVVNLGYCGPKVIQAEWDESYVKLLFDRWYYEIAYDNVAFSFEMPDISHTKTNFTVFVKTNDNTVYLGLNHSGLMKLKIMTEDYRIYIPDTPSRNSYHALTVTSSGKLASTSTYGTLIWDGNSFINILPWQSTTFYPVKSIDREGINFIWSHLYYRSGEHFPISIIEKQNGNLMYCNSGALPDRKFWVETPSIIDLDTDYNTFIPYGMENGIVDGWWGVYSNDESDTSGYMMVNQIEKDEMQNVWITNPFCEKNGNMIAIQSADDDSWSHVSIPDSSSFRPQTIALEQRGSYKRAWIGFAHDVVEDRTYPYSSGGMKILSYSNFSSGLWTDSLWVKIKNQGKLPGNDSTASVWSLVFDEMNFLWVMSEKGIRSYEYYINDDTITLDPILEYEDGTALDLLAHVSYTKGNRIRVDSQNNKWVITHQGIWVIQESMVFWPSEVGLHTGNSGLLSDIVYDVAFDNNKGLAYLATDKGISVLQIPFSENPSRSQSMYLSPNPFIIPDDDWIIIKNVPSGSIIKIMTITGLLIKEINLPSNQSQAMWDGTNNRGDLVGTAVYLVSAYHPSERNKVSKIAVIRK